MTTVLDGVRLVPGFLDSAAQQTLLQAVRDIAREAPLFMPTMPKTGRPFSVRMTNCGPLGWVSDKKSGYRYQSMHPKTGKAWPGMPEQLLQAWQELADYPFPPQACLINFYDAQSRMGLHQDKDEQDTGAPILSLSLGDDCLFRVGSVERGGKTVSFRLESGDALLLEGPARMIHHGVDRIYPGTSMLLKNGGRINLTLRRVTLPS